MPENKLEVKIKLSDEKIEKINAEDNRFGIFRIQIACGLVGQYQLRMVYQRTCYSSSLLFAAR